MEQKWTIRISTKGRKHENNRWKKQSRMKTEAWRHGENENKHGLVFLTVPSPFVFHHRYLHDDCFSAILAILGISFVDCALNILGLNTRRVCSIQEGCYMHVRHVDLSATSDRYTRRPVVPMTSTQIRRHGHAYEYNVYVAYKENLRAWHAYQIHVYNGSSWCVIFVQHVKVFFHLFLVGCDDSARLTNPNPNPEPMKRNQPA